MVVDWLFMKICVSVGNFMRGFEIFLICMALGRKCRLGPVSDPPTRIQVNDLHEPNDPISMGVRFAAS